MRMMRVSAPALAVVGHRAGLAEPLGLVVHAPQADRVHVAPVALGLGVDGRVAVALAGAGHQEAGVLFQGQLEQVPRALAVDLDGGDLLLDVPDRAGRAGHVVDAVDGAVDLHRLDHVGLDGTCNFCLPIRWAMFCRLPVMKLSSPTTSCPCPSSTQRKPGSRSPPVPTPTGPITLADGRVAACPRAACRIY